MFLFVKTQGRDTDGKYNHALERLCKCGRSKGDRLAERPYPDGRRQLRAVPRRERGLVMSSFKVSKSDKQIKAILQATYPEWKGRKVRITTATEYQMSDYWSEGSRNYVQALAIATGAAAANAVAGNPFKAGAHARIEIPSGVALVEHSIFCGKDGGITIYVRPEDLAPHLPGVQESAS
jgi:hypothetical protein